MLKFNKKKLDSNFYSYKICNRYFIKKQKGEIKCLIKMETLSQLL